MHVHIKISAHMLIYTSSVSMHLNANPEHFVSHLINYYKYRLRRSRLVNLKIICHKNSEP